MNAADFDKPFQAFQHYLDVPVILVVERFLLVGKLAETEQIARQLQYVEEKLLHFRHVIDVKLGQMIKHLLARNFFSIIVFRKAGAYLVSPDFAESRVLFYFSRIEEYLQLGLRELTHPNKQIARADFVAVSFADNSQTQRQLLAETVKFAQKIYVSALSRFAAQVSFCVVAQSHGKHQIENAYFFQRALALDAFHVVLFDYCRKLLKAFAFKALLELFFYHFIRALDMPAFLALNYGVNKRLHVT